jgi:hypothetical protein
MPCALLRGGYGGMDDGKSLRGRVGAWSAVLSSVAALVFSVYSLYETVIKRADLHIYQPPLIYMYRENFRDVFAIPITLSNVGTQHGTVLSFDLEVTQPGTLKRMKFQSLHFGESPKHNTRLFTPITVAGRSSYIDVILFYGLSRGSFVEATGSVKLPLRFKLMLNVVTTGGWLATKEPDAVVFDMTADYIQSHNQMEAGEPTQFHDLRWTEEAAAAAATREKQIQPEQEAVLAKDVADANKKCGSGFTVKLDWTGVPADAFKEFSAAGYCDAALEGIRRVCEDALGKDAVKLKIKSMTCGFGGERSISLKDGSLAYTINFNSTNDADFVYAYLQNNL